MVRCSKAGDPESYDGVSGLLEAAPGDGTCVRAAFELRGILYLVKERSLYSTQDDGVNEPAAWTVNEISRVVGTPSVNGVDVGEDWAVIAAREGLYIYDGSEPVKISQEIQPIWDSINWDYGDTIWVRVDTRNRRILCGVPIGAATSPSRVLVLDYRSCFNAGEIESLGPYHFSTYNGKLFAAGTLAPLVPVEYRGELRDVRRARRRHRATICGQRSSRAGQGTAKFTNCRTRNIPTTARRSTPTTRRSFS